MGNDVTYIVQANAEIKVDGVSIGYTTEPTSIRIERDYSHASVEQVKGDIKSFMSGETMTIDTTLAQKSLTNLRIVWDQEGSTLIGGTLLSLGTESGGNEHTMIITALAPTGAGLTYENWTIFKAVSMDAGQFSMSRSDISTVPVSFKCLKDVLNNNNFGYCLLSNSKS